MKYLKKFENFGQDNHPDLGRFSEEEKNMTQPDENDQNFYEEEEEIFNSEEDNDDEEEEDSYEEEREDEKGRIWGDELVEKKKINAGFQAYLDKQKAKKEDKKEDKKETKKSTTEKETTYNKSGLKNPEKADLNKNKKISGYEKVRGKAIQNAVQDEKEEKGSKDKKDDKGLSKAQMNLPEGLRKAIAAKKK